MIKTGNLLKSEREKKGISLHEVSMALKVSTKILRSIEDGEKEHLPAKTFLRGFVRSYAMYLHLNVDEILSLFSEEMGTTRPAPSITSETVAGTGVGGDSSPEGALASNPLASLAVPPTSLHAASEPKSARFLTQDDWFSTHRIMTAAGVAVLVVLIALASRVVDRYQNESKTEPTESPIASVSAKLETENSSPQTSSVESSSGPKVTSSGSSSSLSAGPSTSPISSPSPPSTTTAPAPAPANPPTNLAAPANNSPTQLKPTPTAGSSTSVNGVVTAPTPATKPTPVLGSPTASAAAGTTSPPVGARSIEVIVEAKGSIKVVSKSQDKSETVTLTGSQIHVFRSSSGLRLEISDGGLANIVVNGRDRGPAGTNGKPVLLTF